LSADYARYPAGTCGSTWPAPWVSLGGVNRLAWGQGEEGPKAVDLTLTAGSFQLALATTMINASGCIFGYWDNVSLRLVKALPTVQTLSPNECPFCGNEERQHFAGGPINTFSGNYNYETTDFAIAAVGRALHFERAYNSLPVTGTVVYTRPLGYGWTHSYDLNLSISGNRAELKAPHGSRLGFTQNGGSYEADPGVWAGLVSGGGVYTVTAANQERYVFNAAGRLTRRLDPQGNATELTYNNGLTLTRVTDAASGRYLALGYDPQGRLSTLTDSANRTVRYLYDGADNLSRVVDSRGLTWTYTYSGTHLLHAVTDPAGVVLERTFFDGQGRAVRQENGLGQPVAQIGYQGNNRVVTEAGRVLTDTYDSVANLLVSRTDALNRRQSYDFDAAFNRTYAQDGRGSETRYSRTALGLTTAITDALAGRSSFGYDGRNNLTAVTDARGATVHYTYDGQNNLKTVTTLSGTTVYTYNNRGQATARRDANGRLTQFGYDPTTGNLLQIVNPKFETVNLQYDSLGRLTQFTNARSVVTRYEYDSGDRLTRLIENYRPDPCPASECNLTTQYSYDGAGRLTSVTDPKNRLTRYEYDGAGRLERVIQNYYNGVHESGEAPDRDVITRYEYDGYSRLWQTTDPPGRKSRLVYNNVGQVERVIRNYVDGVYTSARPDEDVSTAYGYDAAGNLTGVTNNAGETVTFTYDALNRLTNLQSPVSNLQYRYDAASNRTALIDPRQIETRYGYDGLNRLTAVIEGYQDGNFNPSIPDQDIITRFGYDPVGNLIRLTDPKSQITNLQYDPVNRLTGIDPSAGSTPDVSLGYDAAGNRLGMADGTGATAYSYDGLNRLTTAQMPGGTLHYGYDLAGNRLSLTRPGNQTTAYGYDGLHRLKTVADWTGGRYTVTWSSAGRLAELARPNGLKTTYGYDTAGRLLTLTHQSPPATVIARYAYTLDAAGQRRQVVETLPGCARLTWLPVIFKSGSTLSAPTAPTPAPDDSVFKSPLAAPQSSGPVAAEGRFSLYLPLLVSARPENGAGELLPAAVQTAGLSAACRLMTMSRTLVYTYDNLARLTGANYPALGLGQIPRNYRYSYDAAGNRATQTVNGTATTYQYNAANRLTQVNTQPYTYDANGNLLSDGRRTYTYDAAHRLTRVVSGSVTSLFTYNGDGDRAGMTVNGAATAYLFDPTGLAQVLAETTGGQSRQYLPGLAQYEAGAWAWPLPDGLGSVRQLTNSSRQFTLLQNYDPFGNVLDKTGAGQSIFGYTGEQTDPTGLIYLRARYYNPVTGRFLTPDSLIPDPLTSMGWNRYLYVNNNPVNYVDPSGHCLWDLCILEVAGVSIGVAELGLFGLGAYAAYQVGVSDAYQDALKGALDLLPPFRLPGTTLDEGINPCHESGPDINRPTAWQAPPFSLTPPLVGPVGPGFSAERPSVLGTNFLTAQLKALSSGEIQRLKEAGIDVHALKGGKRASTKDLFKDKKGDIYVGLKGGKGEMEYTGLNVNDF
jgi:RHS repeat-associated protein